MARNHHHHHHQYPRGGSGGAREGQSGGGGGGGWAEGERRGGVARALGLGGVLLLLMMMLLLMLLLLAVGVMTRGGWRGIGEDVVYRQARLTRDAMNEGGRSAFLQSFRRPGDGGYASLMELREWERSGGIVAGAKSAHGWWEWVWMWMGSVGQGGGRRPAAVGSKTDVSPNREHLAFPVEPRLDAWHQPGLGMVSEAEFDWESTASGGAEAEGAGGVPFAAPTFVGNVIVGANIYQQQQRHKDGTDTEEDDSAEEEVKALLVQYTDTNSRFVIPAPPPAAEQHGNVSVGPRVVVTFPHVHTSGVGDEGGGIPFSAEGMLAFYTEFPSAEALLEADANGTCVFMIMHQEGTCMRGLGAYILSLHGLGEGQHPVELGLRGGDGHILEGSGVNLTFTHLLTDMPMVGLSTNNPRPLVALVPPATDGVLPVTVEQPKVVFRTGLPDFMPVHVLDDPWENSLYPLNDTTRMQSSSPDIMPNCPWYSTLRDMTRLFVAVQVNSILVRWDRAVIHPAADNKLHVGRQTHALDLSDYMRPGYNELTVSVLGVHENHLFGEKQVFSSMAAQTKVDKLSAATGPHEHDRMVQELTTNYLTAPHFCVLDNTTQRIHYMPPEHMRATAGPRLWLINPKNTSIHNTATAYNARTRSVFEMRYDLSRADFPGDDMIEVRRPDDPDGTKGPVLRDVAGTGRLLLTNLRTGNFTANLCVVSVSKRYEDLCVSVQWGFVNVTGDRRIPATAEGRRSAVEHALHQTQGPVVPVVASMRPADGNLFLLPDATPTFVSPAAFTDMLRRNTVAGRVFRDASPLATAANRVAGKRVIAHDAVGPAALFSSGTGARMDLATLQAKVLLQAQRSGVALSGVDLPGIATAGMRAGDWQSSADQQEQSRLAAVEAAVEAAHAAAKQPQILQRQEGHAQMDVQQIWQQQQQQLQQLQLQQLQLQIQQQQQQQHQQQQRQQQQQQPDKQQQQQTQEANDDEEEQQWQQRLRDQGLLGEGGADKKGTNSEQEEDDDEFLLYGLRDGGTGAFAEGGITGYDEREDDEGDGDIAATHDLHSNQVVDISSQQGNAGDLGATGLGEAGAADGDVSAPVTLSGEAVELIAQIRSYLEAGVIDAAQATSLLAEINKGQTLLQMDAGGLDEDSTIMEMNSLGGSEGIEMGASAAAGAIVGAGGVRAGIGEFKNTEITTHLYELIFQDRHDELLDELDESPWLIHTRAEDGRGPLWWAYEFGDPDLVTDLLERGADVTAQDLNGFCPNELGPLQGEGDPARNGPFPPPVYPTQQLAALPPIAASEESRVGWCSILATQARNLENEADPVGAGMRERMNVMGYVGTTHGSAYARADLCAGCGGCPALGQPCCSCCDAPSVRDDVSIPPGATSEDATQAPQGDLESDDNGPEIESLTQLLH